MLLGVVTKDKLTWVETFGSKLLSKYLGAVVVLCPLTQKPV